MYHIPIHILMFSDFIEDLPTLKQSFLPLPPDKLSFCHTTQNSRANKRASVTRAPTRLSHLPLRNNPRYMQHSCRHLATAAHRGTRTRLACCSTKEKRGSSILSRARRAKISHCAAHPHLVSIVRARAARSFCAIMIRT